MYIQLRNREPEAGTKSPRLRNVQEVARFLTHASGDVEFSEWSNEEIRLKPGPGEADLKNHRIDLNAGFTSYYENHVRPVRRSNGCHRLHHKDARHLEKDDTMRKSFEATLKWIKETDFVRRSSPSSPSSTPSSSSSPSPSPSLPASASEVPASPAPVRLITTSSAIHQLLQLPYENEVRDLPPNHLAHPLVTRAHSHTHTSGSGYHLKLRNLVSNQILPSPLSPDCHAMFYASEP